MSPEQLVVLCRESIPLPTCPVDAIASGRHVAIGTAQSTKLWLDKGKMIAQPTKGYTNINKLGKTMQREKRGKRKRKKEKAKNADSMLVKTQADGSVPAQRN